MTTDVAGEMNTDRTNTDQTGTDGTGTDDTRGRRRRFRLTERGRRRLGWTLAIILAIVIIGGLILRSTPWPSAMVIRSVFEQGGAATAQAMERFVPDEPVTEHRDISYLGNDDPDTTFDVVSPGSGTDPLPTIVWVHGGAWISGHKTDVDPYLRILALEGYTTVSLNYTRGPEGVYPSALVELNHALSYLNEHADEYRIDPQRIVLAGDSAGANLASQLATMTTSETYANLLGITPALTPDQLAGVILHCGVYDLDALEDLNGILAWGFQIALWAYTGTQDWSVSSEGATMSTLHHVTSDFPPSYISGGNGDGLTWVQSVPLSRELDELGTDVTTRFWAMGNQPALQHEYQFELHLEEAQVALADTIRFLDRVT